MASLELFQLFAYISALTSVRILYHSLGRIHILLCNARYVYDSIVFGSETPSLNV